MDFLSRLKEHIEGLSFTPSVAEIGLYREDGDSLAIRPAPSNIESRYMEKSKVYPFSFQVLMHNRNNFVAYETIEELTGKLDNLNSRAILSSDGSFVLVSFHCTTTPNFVQKTSYGVLWTAMFEAELYIQGGNG
ncbi:bacteriophage minor capsid protein [Virgibacillus subterraneus]|uniref:Bacteriophage minor capsid protein n=1 Tax=Virgibacillus subterraneus TaxID=621109 RepID=A0A1H8YXE3_9BACI|nr:minor capsid protein [Virgibacillus subterraneus]SEP56854.1 bacteriophage minor capsid protein [Virgibacillus subterraneus]